MSNIQETVVKSNVTLDSVKASTYQKKGTLTAQLRQVIETTTIYPSATVESDLADNLFSTDEFHNIETKDYFNKETRVTWMQVPDNVTPNMMMQVLAQHPDCCIYKILSNKPILTIQQQNVIEAGIYYIRCSS